MNNYLSKSVSAAPLAVFRICFGLLIFLSIVRFWSNGWIEDLYILPKYYFSYYGFEFVKPLGIYTYWLFFICAVSALLVALGCFYRVSATVLFLSFTYIELIDKSTYLNHYYFISMMLLLMIFLPAHVFFSIDSFRRPNSISVEHIPAWTIDSVKLFVCILYFFAGLAKINSDWLLEAIPLKIWLPARNDMPVIGFLFNYKWTHYAFSWIGCIYDLSIPFLLWNSKTRVWAYSAVVVFHLLTSLLFPIGMFPYIMVVTALIFFPSDFHLKVIAALKKYLPVKNVPVIQPTNSYQYSSAADKVIKGFLILFFLFHIIMPFRYLLYPGQLFWTEQGYRFSWRVMLMEKAGYAQFVVKDADGKFAYINNNNFLTPLQEKMMATQPDMILQYAHLLRDYYSENGFDAPMVYVESYVTLNGRLSKTLINPEVDLAKEVESFNHKSWIILHNE